MNLKTTPEWNRREEKNRAGRGRGGMGGQAGTDQLGKGARLSLLGLEEFTTDASVPSAPRCRRSRGGGIHPAKAGHGRGARRQGIRGEGDPGYPRAPMGGLRALRLCSASAVPRSDSGRLAPSFSLPSLFRERQALYLPLSL